MESGTQESRKDHPQITQIYTDSGRARSPLRADEWTATECRPYQDRSMEIETMGICGSSKFLFLGSRSVINLGSLFSLRPYYRG
jgi:hypothetical protein